ncbi:capping complex subunit for YIEGIA [Desulfuribacillus alkaliarsenatis]|uniref:Uncharacterized protein n=1 Tax=Desulfuribacillus alkaliarsenatis TaxID=766136 RepID=A0A1E5G4S6_9FIRM|nr:hypothetical protein [Desulfuribacillus alkaliarsenatis]OEF98176.1 hypothetical protein BHF68_00350 [Desulfuribacillus alkaliarsenatis]
MSDNGDVKGILAYITTDKNRYLGGNQLSLLAKDKEELQRLSFAISRAFLADILELETGDCLIIKR